MNTPIIVNVTAEDIAAGIRYRCEYCPVALGARRATGADKVRANKFRITINDRQYCTPTEVSNFILAFDRGEPVEPFCFPLGEPLA